MPVIARVVLISAALLSHAASAQCTKDPDCKRPRVCTVGQCIAPAFAPQATALLEQRPGLYWPACTLALGAVMFIVGLFVGVAARVGPLAGALALGGSFTLAGAV